MNKMLFVFCLCLSGCSVMQDARTEFKKEVNGFNADFARVFLKKEIQLDQDGDYVVAKKRN